MRVGCVGGGVCVSRVCQASIGVVCSICVCKECAVTQQTPSRIA